MIKGQSCKSSSLTIRIVAGTWCVGCFFLVQIYSSTLTSHLMESNQKPIVNSVQELVNHPDVQLTADRGMAADILLVVRGVSYIHPARSNISFSFTYAWIELWLATEYRLWEIQTVRRCFEEEFQLAMQSN